MSIVTPYVTDSELRREVEQELLWDPAITPASIGVTRVSDDLVIR